MGTMMAAIDRHVLMPFDAAAMMEMQRLLIPTGGQERRPNTKFGSHGIQSDGLLVRKGIKRKESDIGI
jgi:hypothetical protein